MRPAWVTVKLSAFGLLDDDPEIQPDRHIFVECRAAWTPQSDGLPELDKQALLELRTGPVPGTG